LSVAGGAAAYRPACAQKAGAYGLLVKTLRVRYLYCTAQQH